MGQVHWRGLVLLTGVAVIGYGEAFAADAGLKVFVEKRCYTCHSVDSQAQAIEAEKAAFVKAQGVDAAEKDDEEGEGDEKDKKGGDLSGTGKQRNVEWLKKFLKNPKPDFKDGADCQKKAKNKDRKKFKGSPEQFDALVAYLAGLKGEAKPAPGFTSCLKE
jgi:cbb3-type cytochrome oxidase cytochrome c subunit